MSLWGWGPAGKCLHPDLEWLTHGQISPFWVTHTLLLHQGEGESTERISQFASPAKYYKNLEKSGSQVEQKKSGWPFIHRRGRRSVELELYSDRHVLSPTCPWKHLVCRHSNHPPGEDALKIKHVDLCMHASTCASTHLPCRHAMIDQQYMLCTQQDWHVHLPAYSQAYLAYQHHRLFC